MLPIHYEGASLCLQGRKPDSAEVWSEGQRLPSAEEIELALSVVDHLSSAGSVSLPPTLRQAVRPLSLPGTVAAAVAASQAAAAGKAGQAASSQPRHLKGSSALEGLPHPSRGGFLGGNLSKQRGGDHLKFSGS